MRVLGKHDFEELSKIDVHTVDKDNLVDLDTVSIKVRSQLQVKRKRGEFLGAFSPYGYMKDEDNKNKLVIDPYPAQIVKDIFSWKLNGLSQNAICKRLQTQGVLAPSEYKRSKGERYMTPFKSGQQAQWTPVAVRRILTNPVYAGTLVQGVYSRLNYSDGRCKNHIKRCFAL